MPIQPKLSRFNTNVLQKYQVYNGIFMTLLLIPYQKQWPYCHYFMKPVKRVLKTGEDPTTIVHTFFKKYQARRSEQSQINLIVSVYSIY